MNIRDIAGILVGSGLSIIIIAEAIVLILRGRTNRRLVAANRVQRKTIQFLADSVALPPRSVHRSPITPAKLREESAARLRLSTEWPRTERLRLSAEPDRIERITFEG